MQLIYRNIHMRTSKNVEDLLPQNTDTIENFNIHTTNVDPLELSVKITNLVSDCVDVVKLFLTSLF